MSSAAAPGHMSSSRFPAPEFAPGDTPVRNSGLDGASPELAAFPAMAFRRWRRGSSGGDGSEAEPPAVISEEGMDDGADDAPPPSSPPPPPEDDDPNRDYPRPWFYRPEFYIGMFIFPPVWSVLTLRSPWNRNALVGGVAWAILIVGGIFAFQWVSGVNPFFWIPDSGDNVPGGRRWANLVIFLPGALLTVLTQVQWQAHRAQHGPPPSELAEADRRPAAMPPPESAAPGRPPRPRRRHRRRGR